MPVPLGAVYRSNRHYGMAVLDITSLHAIRYGIVGFWLLDRNRQHATVETYMPPTQVLETNRPRIPMSAFEYLHKFRYSLCDEAYELNQFLPINPRAMDIIWPVEPDQGQPPIPSIMGSAHLWAVKPPNEAEQALEVIVRNASVMERFSVDVMNHIRTVPDHQSILRRILCKWSASVGQARSTGQLLGLVFAEQEHMELAPFQGLSARAIEAALEGSPNTKSLSLCVDTLGSTPAEVLDVLARFRNVQHLYFVQDPARTSDKQSVEFFLEFLSKPRGGIIRRKALPTGAFSAALRKEFWIPPNCRPPQGHFPIQHMFVRHRKGSTNKFWPNHFYFGDAIMRPERVATGFISYLRGLLDVGINGDRDHALFAFSAAPPSLANMNGVEVRPIPAESYAIPRHPPRRNPGVPPQREECWARVRDLYPGGWAILISHDAYPELSGTKWTEANYFRYAFVRARVRIRAGELRKPLSRQELDVFSLRGFIRATAPEVDPTLVDQRLEELIRDCPTTATQGTLRIGLDPLGVLGHLEAGSMLLDFLMDARRVERNLHFAMVEDPEERMWYPNILAAPPVALDPSNRASRKFEPFYRGAL